MSQPLILGSSSTYRAQLLQRLGLKFSSIAADIDESRHPEEAPIDLAQRLAREKAHKVSQEHPKAVVIGSDQVAVNGPMLLGKPGSVEAAAQQLIQASGRAVTFYTAVSVVNRATGSETDFMDTTTVHFRKLSNTEIQNYIAADNPLDCAGSFKAEGLGISLFEKIDSTDPTGIVGLPLIRLASVLREQGFEIPAPRI